MSRPLSNHLDFLVNRAEWSNTRFDEGPPPGDLAEGEILFRVDRFAFTANNISYALSGDMIGYWKFFPAEEGWGRIPVMGFSDVVASRHPKVAEGTRCFGFYPMSRYLVMRPGKVNPAQIVDGGAHRAEIAAVYNTHQPTEFDPMYSADHEDQMLLLRGLFMTSYLCDDLLSDNGYYGAKSVLITSASSKTSIALGFSVARSGRARAVGLTSQRNLEFVKSLGCYDEVRTYEEVESLPAAEPVVMVDMAGNADLRRRLHQHFDDQMKYSCSVGATHWDQGQASSEPLPGAQPEFFFAPGQIAKRTQDWGAAGLAERMGSAWTAYRDSTDSWLRVKRQSGRDAVHQVFLDTLGAKTEPSEGQILSLHD